MLGLLALLRTDRRNLSLALPQVEVARGGIGIGGFLADRIARGHGIGNHSERHLNTFSLRGPRWLEREIRAAQSTLAQICGVTPGFFRAPAGLRNPLLEPVLARLDLQLAAWTRRGYDTRNGDGAAVAAVLRKNLAAGDILLLHDGNATRSAHGTPVILEALPLLLASINQAGLAPVTLDAARL